MDENLIKNLPRGEVLDLGLAAGFEQNGISSLTLVQRQSLAITLMGLDAGESIGGHSSNGDALVLILTGNAEITIGEKLSVVGKDQAILMPAHVRHALHAREAFTMLLVVVKPEDPTEGAEHGES